MKFLRALHFTVLVSLAAGLAACSQGTPTSAGVTPSGPAFSQMVDLNSIALVPADVADLFPTAGMSISQPISQTEVSGLEVTYPTRDVQHTMSFVEGFATNVRLYKDFGPAAQAYETLVQTFNQQTVLKVSAAADKIYAGRGPLIAPTGEQMDSQQFVVIMLMRNAVIQLTFRTTGTISEARLGELSTLAVTRLNSLAP